jgi:hypothetical protein
MRVRLDAAEIVGRVWVAHELALEVCEREMVAGDNSSARVGAARSVAAVSCSMIDLAERAGVRVRLARHVPELQHLAHEVLDVADRHGVGQPVADALRDLLGPVVAATRADLPVTTGEVSV